MNKTCETCRWFEPRWFAVDDVKSIGYCHRMPPSERMRIYSSNNAGYGGNEFAISSETRFEFPEVSTTDWCGEWKSKEKQKREPAFVPPTVEEITDYCIQNGKDIDPRHFWSYYEARGWMLGKTKMKDWKAAVRTWEKNQQNRAVKSDKVDQYLEK